MNISNEIIKVLNVLCEKFGVAIDWTSANVIPYLEILCGKFIKWEISTSIFYIVFWTLLAGITWLISIPIIKKAKEDKWDFDYEISPCLAVAAIIVACIFTIITIINIGVQSYDIIEATNFPEKTIYDYISLHIH